MGIKSKIHDELAKAAGINPEEGQSIDDEEYMKKVTRAVAKLSDAEWNKLSDAAGDFHNKLANALNAKKDLPAWPDAVKTKEEAAEEEEAPRRRRRSSEEEEEEPKPRAKKYEPKKGDKVRLVSTKGKEYVGKVLDPDDGGELVMEVNGEEFGFKAERIQSVELAEQPAAEEEEAPRRRRSSEDDEQPKVEEPAVGKVVEIETNRGTVKTGEIVEMGEDEIAIKVGDDVFDYQRKNLKSIKVKGSAHVDSTTSGSKRRSSTSSTSEAEAGEEKGGKVTRDDNGGVSVTLRIREIMCEEPSDPISLADLTKRIQKEGLVCKDNTLKMVHADCVKIFGLLKNAKKLK